MRLSQLLSTTACLLSISTVASLPAIAQNPDTQKAPSTNQPAGSQVAPSRLQTPANEAAPESNTPANNTNNTNTNTTDNPGMMGNPSMSNPSRPNDGMQSSLNSVDRQFMMKAAQSDMTEIMSSRLALQRSNNQNVRSYAQMMIQHHTESSNKLKPLAQQKEVTLPKDISAEQKAMMTKLSKLSGTQFDQAYMNAQVQAHTMTEAEYRKQLAEGQDADVKAFANQILPVVVEHRQMAQNMVARR